MALPTVNSVGAVFGGIGSVTGTVGATHTADDIDIIVLECADSDTAALTTANGFARITALDQTVGSAGAGTQMSVWWRRWNGTDGNPVFADAGDHQIGRMISVSGCVTSGDPWDITGTGTTDSSADTSVSIAGGTTNVADCLVLVFSCQSDPDANTTTEFGSATNGDLANLTERFNNSRNAGNGGAIYLATGEKATAGTFGATTLTATTSALRVCGMLALKPAGAASQGLTGSLFTKAPTFFTGAVTSTYALAGSLFQNTPTFNAGTISVGAVDLAGSLFTKAPTFFAGAIANDGGTQALSGTLFQSAPTFNAGAVTSTYALAGSLFTNTPTFFAGSLEYYTNLLIVELDDEGPSPVDTDHFLRGNARATAGSGWIRLRLFQSATLIAELEFQPTGSFATYEYELLEAEAATITDYNDLQIHVDVKAVTHPFTVEVDWVELERPVSVEQTLGGTLFQSTPTFFAGDVSTTYTLTGTLFPLAPTFFAGVVSQVGGPQPLGGVLFQQAPTFPQGAVTATVGLTGSLFQSTPTFFAGTVTATYNVAGVLFQSTPSFFAGTLIQEQFLTGSLFTNAPTFFVGTLGVGGTLEGVLFTNAPSFFVGAVTQSGGSFWRVNPAGYTLNPAAYTANPAAYDPVLRGEVPPWPIELDGELFELVPTFHVGALT